MRAILDTNILVSALISPSGVPDKLYREWRSGRFTLVTSNEQLDEFKRVTRYPAVRRFIRPAAAGSMHNELCKLSLIVGDLPEIDASRDRADNFLLAMALAAEADFLATGDTRDLLALGRFQRTRIVTARQLLSHLRRH